MTICMLGGIGKVFAKIIQQLLQAIVEEDVADSPFGFRCNYGCTDMIFCVHQLIKKTFKHDTKLILLFERHMILYLEVLCG